ncbi:MAG: hypothetical protein K0R58_291 [Ramlibacter sp.]|jgi:hypothetical protein|nr:hypothetical protein [Ramlibacter sp.]
MRNLMTAMLFLALAASGPALAVNKCTAADGRVTYQDAPCAGGKSQAVDVSPPVAGEKVQPSSEAERIEGVIAASQRSRRALELRERLLPDAEAAVQKNQAACDTRVRELSEQRAALGQNRFNRGAAQEMTLELRSATASCRARDRELKANLQSLARECASLRCRS